MEVGFRQVEWSAAVEDDCRRLIRLAIDEDQRQRGDITTKCLIPDTAVGNARVVARDPGVVAGLRVAELVLDEIDGVIRWQPEHRDGEAVDGGTCVASVSGPAASILTAERLVLNFLGRLSGIATLAACYVAAVNGTGVAICDTRKTTPGWRLLEKYAVRCGGGQNHRTGLYDAILIKDNHLAVIGSRKDSPARPAEAVEICRSFIRDKTDNASHGDSIIEVEVDSLDQLKEVLHAKPDVVLLDNMSLNDLRAAAALRNKVQAHVQLEASGGITLENVKSVADTGVNRISIGALTHAAASLDFGLDWQT